MAASPILTLLYHLEFFQVPVTEYTQKWNKQKTDVQRQLKNRCPRHWRHVWDPSLPIQDFCSPHVLLNTR